MLRSAVTVALIIINPSISIRYEIGFHANLAHSDFDENLDSDDACKRWCTTLRCSTQDYRLNFATLLTSVAKKMSLHLLNFVVIDVAWGTNGAAKGMGPGKGYVDVSTVDGATAKLINKHIKDTGALFLEAPVSGSKKPAEDGQLIFLTAGDSSLYETVAPLLDVMGKSRFYLGEVGNGAAMKLVVNMIMGSMMASFSEGLLLSEQVGLDPNVLVEVISQGAISAPMYSVKGPSMVKASYPTAFPLKHQQKDLRLALGLAESVSQPIPLAAAANELYKAAKFHGLGDQDFSAVIEALRGKLQRPEH